MIPRVIYDVETRSEIDLSERGLDIYKHHPSTEITCATVATDNFIGTASFIPSSDGREALEREMRALGLNVVAPDVVIAVLRAARVIVASNAPFDQGVTATCLKLDLPKEIWSCTAARCRRHGLPGALEHGAKVLGLPEGKDKEGNRLSRQLWKPRPTWTRWQNATPTERAKMKNKDAGPKWFEDAKKTARNCAYNAADVRVSRLLDRAVPDLEEAEREIFLHVWRMNETGIPVDLDLIHGAVQMAEDSRREVTDRIRHYTGGMIQSLQAPGQLVAWAEKYGVSMPSWAKDEVAAAIANPNMPEPVRVVAAARQEAGKGSVAKFETAAVMVSPDGRLRHQIEYAGTSTLRLAGRGVQPLNLPRPKISADRKAGLADIKAGRPLRVAEWKLHYDPERALDAIRRGDLAALRSIGDPEEILAENIRPMICAPSGKKILSPDLSAIEARGVFWISGCAGALAAYRRNEDLYCSLASTIVGFPVNKNDNPEERQLGKVGILQCGYGSGAARVAAANGIEESLGLRIVQAYRGDYPEVPQTWYALEDAAVNAIYSPGTSRSACAGRVQFVFEGGWLRMLLPSGRWLYMPDAGVDSENRLFYHSWIKGDWRQVDMWGGVLINFAIQGGCRDLMYHAEMQMAQRPEHELILQCYDSLTSLVDADRAEELAADMLRVMTTPPPWAADFPLAAEMKILDRYQ